jgi:hypothetical protein
MAGAARWWYDNGFNVILIEPDQHKKPLSFCTWKKWETERQTLDEFNNMMQDAAKQGISNYNIAVMLGEYGGLIHAVIDLDKNEYVPKFFEYFRKITLDNTIVTKPSKGAHIFLILSSVTATEHLGRKGIKIDLQCQAAYVVVPPSLHASAKDKNGDRIRYSFISNQRDEILEYDGNLWLDLIDFIRARLDKDYVPDESATKVDDLFIPRRDHEGRNETAIRVACLYFKAFEEKENSSDLVWNKLVEWNNRNIEPMPEDELRRTFESAEAHRYLYKFDRTLTLDELEEKQALTHEIEKFLKAPDLIDNILKITHFTIVGEDQLCILTYALCLGTVVVDKSFGLIVVDVLGVGKSYVEEKMLKFFPQDRIEQPTSVSQEVVNYLGGNFKGRIVRIDELFGTEEGMPHIRVWMTNGRLERWITDSETHKALKMIVEGSPTFLTSTTGTVEEQYGSRNWIVHTTVTQQQTKAIHNFQDTQNRGPGDLVKAKGNKETEFLREVTTWLMQNQKEVVIPYRYTFPDTPPRMRREKPKFSNLIKCVANIMQLQRETFEYDGKKIIISSEKDFEIVKWITESFLSSTMLTLDEIELKILEWARSERRSEKFSPKEVSKSIDVPYRTAYNRLVELGRLGYLDEIMEPLGTRVSGYSLTELGAAATKVNIEIYDHGEQFNQLYKSLSDSKKQQEFLSLLAAVRERDEAGEREADGVAKNEAFRDKGLSSVSEKQRGSSTQLNQKELA